VILDLIVSVHTVTVCCTKDITYSLSLSLSLSLSQIHTVVEILYSTYYIHPTITDLVNQFNVTINFHKQLWYVREPTPHKEWGLLYWYVYFGLYSNWITWNTNLVLLNAQGKKKKKKPFYFNGSSGLFFFCTKISYKLVFKSDMCLLTYTNFFFFFNVCVSHMLF
jgi:hypothetical protein